MKERELRKFAGCRLCGNLIGASGSLLFYKVSVESHLVKINEIKRQDGIAAMLGGNPYLAMHMGPDEDLTEIANVREISVCINCIGEPLLRIVELEDEPVGEIDSDED